MLLVLLICNVLILGTLHSSICLAQSKDQESAATLSGPRKHLATIIFSGLGGAILGLSTLSFYGRPQDKLNNIGIGFAVGVIAGTGYVTYKMASKPRDFYGKDIPFDESRQVSTRDRLGVQTTEFVVPPIGWTFEF